MTAVNDKTYSTRKYSAGGYSTAVMLDREPESEKEGPWNTAVEYADSTYHSRHEESECRWWGKKLEVQVSSLSHGDRISSATSCALSVQLWLLL